METTEEILSKGVKTQYQTVAHADNIIGTVTEMVALAGATSAQLESDTAKMIKSLETTKEIQTAASLSDKLLRSTVRQIQTNKLLALFILVLIILIIVAIIVGIKFPASSTE